MLAFMDPIDQSSLYKAQVKQLEELLAAVSMKTHKSLGFIGVAKKYMMTIPNAHFWVVMYWKL